MVGSGLSRCVTGVGEAGGSTLAFGVEVEMALVIFEVGTLSG